MPSGGETNAGFFDEHRAELYDRSSGDEFDPAVIQATVDFLAGLAGAGRALELGIGTGRIALPLSQRGVAVHGIDLSRPMLDQLRAKPGGGAIEVTIGDFSTTRVDGRFSLAYLVFNTNVFDLGADHWGIDEYDVAKQGLISHHFTRVGDRIEYWSGPFRCVWPSELDLMARIAGMRVVERWSGWRREPFGSESRKHVSVWEKPLG